MLYYVIKSVKFAVEAEVFTLATKMGLISYEKARVIAVRVFKEHMHAIYVTYKKEHHVSVRELLRKQYIRWLMHVRSIEACED